MGDPNDGYALVAIILNYCIHITEILGSFKMFLELLYL
jgi:hypothetical protein